MTVSLRDCISLLFTLVALCLSSGCAEEEQQPASPDSVPTTEESGVDESKLSSDREQNDPLLNRISPNTFLAAVLDLKALRRQEATTPHGSQFLERFGLTPQNCDRILLTGGVYPRYRPLDEDDLEPVIEEVGKEVSWAVVLDLNAPVDQESFLALVAADARELPTRDGMIYQLNFSDDLLHFTRDGDIVWSRGSAVFDLVKTSHQSSFVQDRLHELKHETAVAAYSSEAFNPYLDHERIINPFLPEYEYIDTGLRALDSGTLILRLPHDSSELILTGLTSESVPVIESAVHRQKALLVAWLTRFLETAETRFDSPGSAMAARRLADLLKTSTLEANGRALHCDLNSFDYLSMIRGLLEGAAEIARKDAALARQKRQIRDIGLAIHWYHDRHKSFPFEPIRDASGNAVLSWRVRLLPYLSSAPFRGPLNVLDFHLDEPWDSEHNLTLLSEIPDAFRDTDDAGETKTRYRVPRGAGLISDPTRSVSFKEIKDGTSKTIMIVQADAAHAIEWTKPDESLWNLEDPASGLEKSGGYCLAGFADGGTRLVDSNMSPEDWIALLTVAGGEPLDPRFVEPFDFELVSWRELKYYASLEETRQKMQRISDLLSDSKAGRVIPRANFDSSDKPLLSWRVHVLPELDYSDLYSEFHLDEPWDSPHNIRLVAKIPPIYQRPGGPDDGKTNYLVPVGDRTVFEKEGISTEAIVPSGGGDGFSSVIFLVEVDDEFAVPWTKPEDLMYDPKQPRRFLGNNYPNGFLVAFGNVPTQLVPPNFSDDDLRALFDYRSGADVSYFDLEIIYNDW